MLIQKLGELSGKPSTSKVRKCSIPLETVEDGQRRIRANGELLQLHRHAINNSRRGVAADGKLDDEISVISADVCYEAYWL